MSTENVVSALLSALDDDEPDVRAAGAHALKLLGQFAATENVVNALLSALEDEELDVRRAAARALGSIGRYVSTENVVSALLSALDDDDPDDEPDVRAVAANALVSLVPYATTENVVKRLVLVLRAVPDGSDVESSVTRALYLLRQQIGMEGMAKALVGALDEAYPWIWSVADSLGTFIRTTPRRREVICQLLAQVLSRRGANQLCERISSYFPLVRSGLRFFRSTEDALSGSEEGVVVKTLEELSRWPGE